MTKEQAISEGYTHFGYHSEGYQSPKDLSELCDSDFEYSDGEPCLFEKESASPTIDVDSIIDMAEENWIGETGSDDTSDCRLALIEAGVEEFCKKANEKLAQHVNYYRLSGIKLLRP